MNLIPFKTSGPIAGIDDTHNTGIVGRRWCFIIEKWRLGFEHQLKFNDYDWTTSGVGYYICGFETDWKCWTIYYGTIPYGGAHYGALWLGPFYINWSR